MAVILGPKPLHVLRQYIRLGPKLLAGYICLGSNPPHLLMTYKQLRYRIHVHLLRT